MVVQDHREPRAGRLPGLVEDHHVKLVVVGLPQIVGMRRLPAQHQLEVVAVSVRTVGQCHQPRIQAGDDPPDHRV